MGGRETSDGRREARAARGESLGGSAASVVAEVWGVLNVTPDSFSDGGLYADVDAALAHARAMLAAGADVIDVGGASSRPPGRTYGAGAAPVSVDEEKARVLPVVELIARELGAKVSIDTTSGVVARAALEAGAIIVNDVSMGADEDLLDACAEAGAELVLMHTRDGGRVEGSAIVYGDLVGEVLEELEGAIDRARVRGIEPDRIWIDPGLGFAKTAAQSRALLAATSALTATGHPVLVGASRKSFLRGHSLTSQPRGSTGVLGGVRHSLGATPAERLPASLAAAVLAAIGGARAVRVHDVAETVQALAFTHAVMHADEAFDG